VVGGEIGGRVYPIEGLDIFGNYAINYSSQSRPDGCNVPEDNRTSRHKLNLGVQVRSPIGLDGEVTFHYQSAQSWGEQVATLSGIEYRIFDLPGYTLLNARLGYRFYKNRAEVSATVFNALAGVGTGGEPPQHHPFGNRVGRRFMGFFSYSL
jgi:iron complex outermembrane receptor protein